MVLTLFSTQTEGDSGKRPNTVAPSWFDAIPKEYARQAYASTKTRQAPQKRPERYARAVSLSVKYVVLGSPSRMQGKHMQGLPPCPTSQR